MSNVYPSGREFAMRAGPVVLPAPGWFSTITGWPPQIRELLANSAGDYVDPTARPERVDHPTGLVG